MFKNRSSEKELLDEDTIPAEALFQNLKELDTINHLLGGYDITFNALKKVLAKDRKYTLVDIGSGGGDTLKRIDRWTSKYGYQTELYGIDLKDTCIEYASTHNPNNKIHFICDDYRNIATHLKNVDIIHACLFCHHLTEQEIISLIQFAQKNRAILVINDLERNRFAYYAIKFLTQLFSRSYLVKNDAPLSVLRGFKKKEWLALIKQSGAINYSVSCKWAFRHEVIIYAE